MDVTLVPEGAATEDVLADATPRPFVVDLQVVIGPLTPLQPGVDFGVLAEAAGGRSVEITTDASGRARLELDAALGPWDVTVAREGFDAVSILGAMAPFDGEIYVQRGDGRGAQPGLTVHRVSGTVTGIADGSRLVRLLDTPDAVLGADHSYAMSVSDWSSAPPLTWGATEWTQDAAGQHPTNIVVLPPQPRVDRDLNLDLAFPAPAVPVTRSEVRLVLPREGLLTAAQLEPAPVSTVFKSVVGAVGLRVRFAVGAATVAFATDDVLAWRFETFGGALAPDLAMLAVQTHGTPVLRGELGTRVVTGGTTVTIPPVHALATEATARGDVVLRADAPGYDYAGFVIARDAMQEHGHWAGYTVGGPARLERPLPHLPRGLTFARLCAGGCTLAPPVTACVGRLRAGGRAAWGSEAESRDAVLCSDARAVLSGR